MLSVPLCYRSQNVTANHRVNDVIANEDGPQTLVGRFMYGPLDMVTLTGEKVKRFNEINPNVYLSIIPYTNPKLLIFLGGHLLNDTTSVWPLGEL